MPASQPDPTRRLLLKGSVSALANTIFPGVASLFPVSQSAVALLSPMQENIPVAISVPNCLYEGLFEQPHIRALKLYDCWNKHQFPGQVAWWNKANEWWGREDNIHKGKDEAVFIEEALQDVLGQLANEPEQLQPKLIRSIRAGFPKSIRDHFTYKIRELIQSYSLDADTLKAIEKSEQWQFFRKDLKTAFKNVNAINHEQIEMRIMENVRIMADLFDAVDRHIPAGTDDLQKAIDIPVYDVVRDLKVSVFLNKDLSQAELKLLLDQAEAESLALVGRMSEREKIELLIEQGGYYSGAFEIPDELKTILPPRSGIIIREFMSRDTDFKEQSPESYAAMEKRLRHLRQRMTEFFASRKIFDVANKIDSLPTSARVVATMRSMANMAPGKARELVTSLTTIFRKGVMAIVETPAIRQTPETTQEPEIPALTHQKPDDSFTGIDLAARSDLAKKEFVPR